MGRAPRQPAEFLPLTPLSFDILLAMADGPVHGYGIIQEIERRNHGPMKSSTGTLYLAIQRLDRDGLIEEHDAAAGSRKRLYGLTALGLRVAVSEAERLAEVVGSAHRKRLLDAERLAAALDAAPSDPR